MKLIRNRRNIYLVVRSQYLFGGVARQVLPTSLVPGAWLYPTGSGSAVDHSAAPLCHAHAAAAFSCNHRVFVRYGLA